MSTIQKYKTNESILQSMKIHVDKMYPTSQHPIIATKRGLESRLDSKRCPAPSNRRIPQKH